jgi:gamma-glutamylcyclotransferase (GGCT)/AIG2-like uncharacterized protein YtfP
MSVKKYLVLVYGSLRVGEYNYNRFKKHHGDNIKVVAQKLPIVGYNLYDLGSYPGITLDFNGESKPLICDLLEVSQSVKDSMDNMEFGAGYREDFEDTEFGEATIYVYEWLGSGITNKVESGDWSEYLKQKNNAE